MHPYIPHLLADIEAAHRTVKLQLHDQTLAEIVEQLEERDQVHPFGYYCGLKAANFPPAEQLKNADLKLVIAAFKKMLQSWNAGCHLPSRLTPRKKYSLLVQTLERNFNPDMQCSVTWTFHDY